jgi:hypothetical protein
VVVPTIPTPTPTTTHTQLSLDPPMNCVGFGVLI